MSLYRTGFGMTRSLFKILPLEVNQMRCKMLYLIAILSIITTISCEREWISGEFIKQDTGSKTSDAGIYSEEPAKEEPTIIKKADLNNSRIYSLSNRLIIPTGKNEGEIGLYEGGEDELPFGPLSFAVDKEENIYILDSINGAVKGFGKDGAIKNIISLLDKARSIVDIVISKDNNIALADINSNQIYLLTQGSKSISEYIKRINIPSVNEFSGLFSSLKGNIYIRHSDQQSIRIGENGIHIPFMSIVSRTEDFFMRTRRISESLSVLFISSQDGNINYKGNTEKQLEIMLNMPILSVSLIDTDSSGRSYLLVEADNGGREVVNVKRFVIRAGPRDEDWSKPFEIPLDVYAMPFKDIVIGEDGTVYAMLVYRDRVEVTRWKAE